jgi:L-seryl-tRNA(Ser) seleniumtransferase
MPNIFRNLPSVNQLLEHPRLKEVVENVNHRVVVDGVRTFLDDLREQVSAATEEVSIPTPQEMADRIADWLETEEQPALQPVINATGVILHTGLGRAPLADSAVKAVSAIAAGYASVEVDLRDGQRGQRIRAVERLLCELTGAEAAVVVNNNAAATMLTLSALAKGKEVIVSRGQLIEIGGSYRLPDVMECSGAKLKEVGTTNKTHSSDYAGAIHEETGALLRVHPSNYEIVGFTESVSTAELAKIAAPHGLPVIDDIGSGALIDFSKYGLSDEPVASASIRDGADVVLFSGDKLIGGPQCGIVVGKKKYIQTILRDPLMRAMRVGKMTLAALNATLQLYRNGEQAEQSVPILQMLSMPTENLKLRAEKVVTQISSNPNLQDLQAVEDFSMLGGGSLPTQRLPTWCVSFAAAEGSINSVASAMRELTPPIFGRVNKDRMLLDMRTVRPSEDLTLVDVMVSVGEKSAE